MLLIITTEWSFVDVEEYLLSIGLHITATMLNETSGKKLVWIKRTCWDNPLRMDELPLHITKREPFSYHINL